MREHYQPGVPASIPEVTETVDSLLWNSAADFPDRIALDFLGRTITYGELATLTRKAASALYRSGVRRGDVVALVLPNCPQHFIAFFAVLSLGAVVSEHNPLAPASDLLEQFERNGVRVVIAWEQTIEKLTSDGDFHSLSFLSVNLGAQLPLTSRFLLTLPLKSARTQRAKLRGDVPVGVLSFDRIVKKAPAAVRATASQRPDVNDTAVLIHTGGTTGKPKAVELTHYSIMANVAQTTAWIHGSTRGSEVVAGVLPFFHAFGMTCVLGVGVNIASTIVLLPRFDIPALLAAHRRYPITLLPGVAPMFERILLQCQKDAEAGRPDDLSSIRWAFSGAMALDPSLAARWEAATGGLIVEGYGMSEASPIISGSPCSNERRPSTLGIPFPSTEVRIADPQDLDKDAKGVGEILVRGPQVFKGYLHDPEETAAIFHKGWLRTGDLAYWDNGFIVMAARSKEMIINGGFNIYPSQVEDAIKSMPGVRDVAVVGMPDEDRGESVVAVLVLEPGARVDLDSVRRWTADKLSHYAMPRSIAIRDDLPRSQIGKVMRRVVREDLANYELTAGMWRKKAAELSENFSEARAALAEGVASVKEQVAQVANQFTSQLAASRVTSAPSPEEAGSDEPSEAEASSTSTPEGASNAPVKPDEK